MSRYFKHYLHLISIIGIAIFIYAGISFAVTINLLWLILLCFTVISEVVSIQYSSNKNISLVGPLSIVSLVFLNLTSTLIMLVCMHLIISIIRKYYYKELDKMFNDKLFFNIFCISISTTAGFLISQLDFLFGYKVLTLIFMVLIHDFVNYMLVTIVVYLYTGNKAEAKFSFKQIFVFSFYFFMTALFLIVGFRDYSYVGLLSVYIFIATFQTNMLISVIGEELNKNFYNDTLTGAYNRNYLDKIITDKLHDRIPFTILFLDFDRFKLINDTYGHLVGDKILVHFVNLLKSNLEGTDKIIRYGGDEFCIILKNPNDRDIILEKLLSLKEKYQMPYENELISYDLTIGDYTYNGEKDIKSYQILEYVDKLMYERKEKSEMKYKKI